MSGNTLNGAQVIVDYLIQEKVPQVFGLCGHGNIQFIDALYERSARYQGRSRRHHESVAGFMADVLLPRSRAADGDLHLLRARFGQSADLTRQRVPRLGAVPGGDRNVPTSQFNRGAFQELFTGTIRRIFRRPCATIFTRRLSSRPRRDGASLAIRQAWKT